MNLQGLSYRRLPIAGVSIALLISVWLSVPIVLGNSITSENEPGWPFLPIALVGGISLVWFAIWNSSIVFAGSYARRFAWWGRSLILALTVLGALALLLLLTAGWVFVVTSVQDWALIKSSELWYSAARNCALALDKVVVYSFVTGSILLAATQLLPNPSVKRTA